MGGNGIYGIPDSSTDLMSSNSSGVRDSSVLHVTNLQIISVSEVVGNRGVRGGSSQGGCSNYSFSQTKIIHGRLCDWCTVWVASTHTKGAGNAGNIADDRRGETDLAVTSGPPDADVVVLVRQMHVVRCCGCSQACCGARVPVKTGYFP